MTATRPRRLPFPLDLVRATWLIFGMHLKTTFSSRRVLAAIVLSSIAPLVGVLGTQLLPEQMDGARLFAFVGVFLQLGFVVPMLSVALGVGAVADEAEGRTITYPFTRPIPRASLFLGRWLAALCVILAFVSISTLALGLASKAIVPGPGRELQAAVLRAALLGAVVYSIGAAVVGVQFKRGLVIALAYTFAFELLVANVPGSSQTLTVQYHLRAMVIDVAAPVVDAEQFVRKSGMISAGAAETKLLIISAVLFVLGCWRTARKQFVLSA